MTQEERDIEDEAGRLSALEAQLRKHHGVSLEQVLGEVEYLRDPDDSVIAGGSLAYGLGNRLSDLDLLIAGSTTAESSRVPLEQFIGSLRVDVWKLAQGLIEETFERAEEALASEVALHDSFGDSDHETEPKLLHRIAYGVVVDGPGLELPPQRDYRAVATGLVVREYAERMRASALLAQLALRAERPLAAVVNARQAVEEALNATVAHRGLPYSGDKWLGERLLDQALDLGVAHEPFRCLPEDPARDGKRFVEEALRICAGLWGLELEVSALAPTARWYNPDLRTSKIGDEWLLLSPRFGGLWEFDRTEAEAWDRLASTAGAAEPGASWSLEECDGEALDLCLRLHERGLLELRWTRGVAIDRLEARRGALA